MPPKTDKAKVAELKDTAEIQYLKKLARKLNFMRQRQLFCDLCIKTKDGDIFLLHKTVMCTLSEAILSKCMVSDSNPVIYETPLNITGATITFLIDFAYSGKLDVTKDNVADLLVAAEQLKIPDVTSICQQFQKIE